MTDPDLLVKRLAVIRHLRGLRELWADRSVAQAARAG